VTHPLGDGQRIELPELGIDFEVIAVPGHTRGHIAYYRRGMLFCGDVLFGAGCGRVFEGTMAEMQASLARLAALPGDTAVYCAHEYTEANLRFARAVEPDNAALLDRSVVVTRLRSEKKFTVPSTLAAELATNPFLRWDAPAVIAAARDRRGSPPRDAVEVFAAIRAWKDRF
jgi:hydroxyacylglutathione hydrolase